MKTVNLIFCPSLLAVLAGCATQQPSRPQYSGDYLRQKYAEEDHQLAQYNAVQIQAATQKELEQLRTENASLRQKNQQLVSLLQLSDAITEHKDDLIKKFQGYFEDRKAGLFETMGGRGDLKEFEVEDVFVYKGYVGVNMLFLWLKADSSVSVGRGFVALDPDKNYNISDCEMLGQRSLTQNEYTSLAQNNGSQIQQELPQTERPNPEKFKLTNETKNHLIEAGGIATFGVLATYLDHLINSDD